MKCFGVLEKAQRGFKILIGGNYHWFLHRIRLLFFSFKEHSSALSFVESQKIKPILKFRKDCQSEAKAPKSILFISHDLKREGAAISLFELVQALHQKLSLPLQVISLGDGPLLQSYEQLKIPVSVIPYQMDELTTAKRCHAFTRQIRAKIKSFSPDLVFANTLLSFPAILAAHKEEIPSVWNVREGVSGESGYRTLPYETARMAISCAAIANRMIFVSESTRRKWNAYESLGKFEVISNALNPERFCQEGDFDRVAFRRSHGIQSDSFVFLCVGSLEPRKGQLDLIQAFKILPKEFQNRCEVILLGNQDYAYAQKIKRCSRGLRIHLIDSKEQVRPFYEIADAFVLCSRNESYPRVILEAMAASLAIITTPVDGVLEQVRENENALFCTPFDHEGLAKAMCELLSNPEQASRMGKRSKEIFDALPDFQAMIQQYSTVLRSIDT